MATRLPDFGFLKQYSDYKFIKPVMNSRLARVACCTDPACVSDTFVIDEKRAAALFRQTLLEFTGKGNVRDAMQGLFPKFNTDLRVSIKINTASSYMPSHQCIAFAISDALVEAGLSADNIMIWERAEGTMKDAGYQISTAPGKVKVIGTNTPGYGYDTSRTEYVHGVPVYLSSIITKHSDCLINLAVLKNHIFAGATLCQKNLFGAIPLADRPFFEGPVDIVRLHLNSCDPYISELNALVAGKIPTVLYVVDGLLGLYNNGPLGPPQWVQNEILMSNDPVAVDTLAFYRIERMRREAGLPPRLNKALYLRTSADMGLGTNNPENMEIITKTL
jgi:uncharacterized protein (DUF362 family)